jgi:type I restriction enzyme, S subunit
MSLNSFPLGHLISSAPKNLAGDRTELPVLSMTMKNGLVDQSTKFKKRIASEDVSPYKVVRRGQLVVGFPIDEGVLAVQNLYDEALVSPAYGVWDINTDLVNNRFLVLFLKSQQSISYYLAKLRGSTARRRSLPTSIFLDLMVPLPELEEQVQVIRLLDEADELRAQRQQSNELLDELARSFFSELVSEKKIVETPLSQLCSIAGEYGLGASAVAYSEDKPRYVRITDVKDSGELKTVKVSPSGNAADWEKYLLLPGDLLFARSGATVGKAYLHGLETEPHVFAGYLIRFRVRTELLLPEVLWAFTKSEHYDKWVLGIQRTVAQPNINAKQFGQELLVPVPSMELQIKFSVSIRSLWAIRKHINFQLSLFDEMYASLQDRAFKGEL